MGDPSPYPAAALPSERLRSFLPMAAVPFLALLIAVGWIAKGRWGMYGHYDGRGSHCVK
jgi:hypothetical protein